MAGKNDTAALVTSFVLTLGVLGAATWWLTGPGKQYLGHLVGASSSTAIGHLDRFDQVSGVPQGVFNYGGSTTWAAIRGQVDPTIARVYPNFQLRYTQSPTAPPGSGTGIAMLLADQLSFSQSSRPLQAQEYQRAKTRGFELKEVPVAIDSIAVVVNPGLSIPGLTVTQLAQIYTGRLTNWRQVGGPNLQIIPYTRSDKASGTVEFFKDNVMAGKNFGPGTVVVATTTQALERLARNPGGIYFASAPEVVPQCTVKPLALRGQDRQLVPPYQGSLVLPQNCSPEHRNQLNRAAFKSGEYPVTRRLFVIVKENGGLDQQAGTAYANLLLTNQGQALINQTGFVGIR